MSLPLGRFHEISLSTRSLVQSLQFYESLGFSRGDILPVWPHPYAVVSRNGLTLGLHEYAFPSPSFTTVQSDIELTLETYREVGMHIAFAKTGSNCFNEFGFRDPAGHMITLLERPTHTIASARGSERHGILSLPSVDPEISERFWRILGGTDDETGFRAAGLPLTFHSPDEEPAPMLVIRDALISGITRLESPEGVVLQIRP